MTASNPTQLTVAQRIPSTANALAMIRNVGEESFIRIDPSCADLLQLNAEELGTRSFVEWLHPDDKSLAEQALAAGNGTFEARHGTGSGDWIPLTWQVKADASTTAVIGLLSATTNRIATPLAGPPTRGTLGETLDAMARVVESSNPGLKCSILLVDSEGRRVSVGAGPSLPAEYNAAVEGLEIGPAVGSCGTASYWNVPVIVEDIASDPLWRNLRSAASIAGVAACWSYPVSSTGGDVLGAMALYSATPGQPTPHQIAGLEIASRMVGLAIERDRLEDQLRHAAKMEALGVLAGGIAHDFNNVLAAILGNAELVVDSLSAQSPHRKPLEEIVTATANATDLCNQMLAYAGRGATSVETIECNELVRELGGLLQVTLSKKATLSYELSERQPLGVLADRGQLRQVIMNLITNASEALGDAPGSITLASSCRHYDTQDLEAFQTRGPLSPGEFVCLQVQDTGEGMSEQTLARMFDPFFSTKSAGRGLGLAAAKGIVLGHNGAIAVDTTEGVGTTFTILLPWVPVNVDSATPAVTEWEPSNAEILLADDEPAVRRILCKILAKSGYRVTAVADGEAAVDAFQRDPARFDCVILDLSMPKLDGAETFEKLREMRPDLQVILSSGFTEREILDRFAGQGLAAAVQKPTSMEVLRAKVAQAVRIASQH